MLQRFSYDELYRFSKAVFIKTGCSDEHASVAAKSLIAADLRGIDSHGVARLSGYVRLWEAGRIDTKATAEIIHETPSTATVNANKGLGLYIGQQAMQIAINKAKEAGTGWVSVKNSSHFGIAGHHAMMALEDDMIGIAMTNASPLVSPTFSIDKLLGTNPLAVAIPAGNEAPFVADFATTTAANGKLEIFQRQNKNIPYGWAQTNTGEPTDDADILKKGGALLPLGGDKEHGSHKGYALGAIVDIFSAILSGANYGPWVPPFPAYVPMPEHMPGEGIGHFFGAMRIDAFRPAADFKKHMDNWIITFKNARAAKDHTRVYIPGEIEREAEVERTKTGIPLLKKVIQDLEELGKKMQVSMPALDTNIFVKL
ncbi:Ldh family oxidoreductase [soil metagenome]